MENKSMNKEMVLVGFIIIFSIAIITVLYIYTPTKKEDIQVELIKLIAQGAVIGILGLWIKFLFDEASRKREQERSRLDELRAKKQKTEEMLGSIFHQLIRLCRRAKDNAYIESRVSATSIFDPIDGYEYLDLVDHWLLYEPNAPAERARKSFELLMDKLREVKDEVTPEKRALIKQRCSGWIAYFERRFFCLASGEEPDNVNEPEDWQVES